LIIASALNLFFPFVFRNFGFYCSVVIMRPIMTYSTPFTKTFI